MAVYDREEVKWAMGPLSEITVLMLNESYKEKHLARVGLKK